MELVQQLQEVITSAEAHDSSNQNQTIEQASKLFDDLVQKGFIERSAYRLSSSDLIPPKAILPVKCKVNPAT